LLIALSRFKTNKETVLSTYINKLPLGNIDYKEKYEETYCYAKYASLYKCDISMAMDNFSIKFRVFTGKFSRLMSQFSRLFVRFIYQYTVYHFNSTTHTRGSYFMLNTKEINSCFKLASKKSSFLQETDCANVTKVKMIVKLLPAVGKLARQNRMQILRPHKSR
jgi:hypothetical protein